MPKRGVEDQLLGAKRGVEALVLTAYGLDASEFVAGAQKVRLHIADMGTNLDDEPALSRYLHQQTSAYLGEQVHLELRPEPSVDVDSVLEQHVVATRDAAGARTALMLVAIVKNAKSGVVIAGSAFPIAQLPQSAEYLAYEKTHAGDGAVAVVQTRLRITADNVGKHFQTVERVSTVEYQTSSRSNASVSGSGSYKGSRRSGYGSGNGNASAAVNSTSSTSKYRDFGTSGWYPMDQQVILNGSTHKLDRDGLFLDETVPPGTYQIVVSFREGFWDAVANRQVEGKKHEKAITVNAARGENVRLNVVFVCDDKSRDILISRL